MTRPPHRHRCGGCGKEWTCSNARCLDLPTRLCCSAAIPPKLSRIVALESAGHSMHEAAFYYRRLRETELVTALEYVRDVFLARAKALSADAGYPLELPALIPAPEAPTHG